MDTINREERRIVMNKKAKQSNGICVRCGAKTRDYCFIDDEWLCGDCKIKGHVRASTTRQRPQYSRDDEW